MNGTRYMTFDFKITNVKNSRGHEGESCPYGTMVLNGKKVGEFAIDTHGGPNRYDFTDTSAESAINIHCAIQPNVACDWDANGFAYDIDYLIHDHLQAHERARLLKREMKKDILVLADGKVTFWKIKHHGIDRYDDVKAAALKKYPGCVILNEIDFAEALQKARECKVFG